MSPQCNADESPQEFDFGKHFQRQVTARFDGGRISSDGGAVLLGEVDRRLGLLDRVAACFQDRRDPERIEHSVSELVKQRVYANATATADKPWPVSRPCTASSARPTETTATRRSPATSNASTSCCGTPSSRRTARFRRK